GPARDGDPALRAVPRRAAHPRCDRGLGRVRCRHGGRARQRRAGDADARAGARMSGLPTLVLASGSPRRKQLLAMLGITILVQPPWASSRRPARGKARAVPGRMVLGADTIVLLDGEILEKPSDDAHALAMLTRLQARSHEVLTSICLVADGVERHASDQTTVT